MKSLKTVQTYIGLGSNKGDRFGYLQKALKRIHEQIGKLENVSSVYASPAWGFKGNDFLNACVQVKTRLAPAELLNRLLQIEKEMGRRRTTEDYENRTLDLDLLYYGQEILQTPELTLPHPGIANRKFVLQPLADIAPDFLHPLYKKSTRQLLEETQDATPLEKHPQNLELPKIDFKNLSYLAIEGNIGAGKTSLATMIAQDFNAKRVTERFKDNPFLPQFYKDQKRYAFPLEMSFLADRYQQLVDDIYQYDLFNDFIVSDYDIYKSMIFAGVTLEAEEFQLYKRLFQIMYKDLPKPDLYIYLHQNTDRLLQNIKMRGRSYEQNIPAEYLEKINQSYLDFIQTQNHLKVKIIDVSRLDFVKNREDYLELLATILN